MSSGVPVFVKLAVVIGAAVLLAGVVAGIVLIVLGAVKRRRGVLIAGVVVLVATGAIMLATGMLAGFMFYAVSAPVSTRAPVAVAPRPAEMTVDVGDVPQAAAVEDILGLRAVATDPPELRLISRGGDARLLHCTARVGAGFETALQWHFEKTTWPEARRAAAGHGDFDPVKLWPAADLDRLPCHRRRFDANGRRHVAHVLYDAKARMIYCFRIPAETDAPPGTAP